MNPIKQIGRFEIPIASIAYCEKLPDDGWLVHLIGGHRFMITAEEKLVLDAERELHSQTMEVLHMVAHLQGNNRPH